MSEMCFFTENEFPLQGKLQYVLYILTNFSDQFLMVIGGKDRVYCDSDKVELISLDPLNNPVPPRLQNLGQIPVHTTFFERAGAMTKSGKSDDILDEAKLCKSE